ncbi:MAG: DUF1145 domain-containing protein [Pseudomonadota bacterium]
MPKIILLIVWAIVAVSFFVDFAYSDILSKFGIALAVIHVVEFFIYRKNIEAKGDGLAKSFLMTLVFGVVYIRKGG